MTYNFLVLPARATRFACNGASIGLKHDSHATKFKRTNTPSLALPIHYGTWYGRVKVGRN